MAKLDIISPPPTEAEQEVIARIRATEYGEITAKIQAGKIVLIVESSTHKVQPGVVPYCNYK